ncbi:hypothetical protein OOZ63_10865 [Paucibacter sp. PLA-PC-4]|uniref:right-handed parallel beta-helix repeat-containing protein n=1 Tax=Paucibacter sp. PLA-PC-4 TaxID=2993655 RepID=UPI00224877DA|nr:right-handed parallel beta-helix repeat-containing protein [Paucibacter sp. PLA-PC-4]MCX2862341.1 hypothetical protein [Paucibacter sp. PLA-PC-4]
MQPSTNPRLISTLCVTLMALCSAAAKAQTLLDHNRAMSGNATPGDTPGYPITLSQPGHYVLKSNLNVPDGLSGILIQTEDVTLDLNGFTIKAGRSCSFNNSNYVVSCSAAGGLYGIDSSASPNTTVRNGSIRGFSAGIFLGGGLIEGLAVRHNLTGIMATNDFATRITGVLAEMNSKAGIYVDDLGLVDNVVAVRNTIGIDSYSGSLSTVRDSLATKNSIGIRAGTLRSNRAALNKSDLVDTSSY